MKKSTWKGNLLLIGLFMMCVLIPVGWGLAIDWIQYNERLAGENSPLYEDVLNRPAKEIWQNFTSEHYDTGAHKPGIVVFPTPLPTPTPVPLADYLLKTTFQIEHTTTGAHQLGEYLIYGDGLSNVASMTFTALSGFFTDHDIWAIFLRAYPSRLNTAEGLYTHISTAYSTTIVSFAKTADNRLSLQIGTNTYTSAGTSFTNISLTRPIEYGVIANKTAATIVFCYDGYCEAAITGVNFTLPDITESEQHILGNGFAGAMYSLVFSGAPLFQPNSWHVPISEELSACVACVVNYPIDGMSEHPEMIWDMNTLNTGSPTFYDLEVHGSVQAIMEGY